jgi:hypothetical protein
MLRSTTISIRSDISSLAGFTNEGEPSRWPGGAPSRPSGRSGLGELRHMWTTGRYFDEACEVHSAFFLQCKGKGVNGEERFGSGRRRGRPS